jgi:hypothetical protein
MKRTREEFSNLLINMGFGTVLTNDERDKIYDFLSSPDCNGERKAIVTREEFIELHKGSIQSHRELALEIYDYLTASAASVPRTADAVSDEKIYQAAKHFATEAEQYGESHGRGFMAGARWMRDQLQKPKAEEGET